MKISNTLLAHLYLFFVALIYGANYTIARIVLNAGLIAPNGFILLRIFSALFLFVLFFGWFKNIKKEDRMEFLVLSIFGVLINQLFFFNGLARTSPIHASLIMLTTPILVLIFTSINSGKNFKLKHWLGTLLGLLGTLYLVLSSKDSYHNTDATILGDLMIFINAISYAIYLSRVSNMMMKYNSLDILKWVFALAFLMCLPFGFSDIKNIHWSDFQAIHYYSLAFVLIGTSFLAYLLNVKAIEISNASLAGNYIYLQPLIAVGIACVLGGEALTIQIIFSGILIFFGLYLSTSSKLTE